MSTKGSELVGKTVSNTDGHVIGEVTELVVDTDAWNVSDIQVKIEKSTGKELGLKTPLFGSLLVLVETARITSTTDQVILDIAADGFRAYLDARQSDD